MLKNDCYQKDISSTKYLLEHKGTLLTPLKISNAIGHKRRNLYKTNRSKDRLGLGTLKRDNFGLSTTLSFNVESAIIKKEINDE